MAKVILKAGKDIPVRRAHPWIFSGAVDKLPEGVKDGDLVEVYSRSGDFLGQGHYQDASIKVRLISFEKEPIDQDFWVRKIAAARNYRRQIGLPCSNTNCYRLVHASGDGLPGLIVDVYGSTAVVQCHSIGMHLARHEIAGALSGVLGGDLKAVFDKSKKSLPSIYGAGVEDGYLFGEPVAGPVLENGLRFEVDWEKGQKTGFFLDQRDNRALLAKYVSGKSVLNTFCYTGGFSVYALRAGAGVVHSVDISKPAIEMTCRNVALNDLPADRHEAFAGDVLKFLKSAPQTYEVMVVDPPAYAKSVSKRHNAVQGYKRLNALAIRKIAPGGILFTFSCSKVVDKNLFYHTIVAAAIEAGREVRVMHHLSQPPDHPVNLFHEQGAYLKGLVLYVV
ncbi:MAG: class I SAM-dependent rRNA methyltransferase [Bacteroidetes bacterium]|nr:MAG: class I SAM-dependent rRNA methyltransferase [Bacteroidota bacterium]